MTETEFTKSTISSFRDSQDIPFYKKYPTPIYDKNELHKDFGGLLYERDFNMECKYPSYVDKRLKETGYFNTKLKNSIQKSEE